MAGESALLSAAELERGRGRRVKSNDSVDKMKIYGGIGVAGVAAGAAMAIANDPLYDDEKRLRGIEPKRKMAWDPSYTPLGLDGFDNDMYDFYKKNGNYHEAYMMEQQARQKFDTHSYEHQRELVKAYHNPTPEIKGSFKAKMLTKARKAVSKL